MSYTELEVKIRGELAIGRDITIAQLAEIGYESFEENDDGLKAYIDTSKFDKKLLSSLTVTSSSEFHGSEISHRVIETVNWNQEWEESYQPVSVNDFCHIRALFHAPSEGYRYNLQIHPKMSFGTGHHETTWLMVESMSSLDLKEMSVLDMGCGTGVLAILAHKMGAVSVTAVDIDSWAIENSKENIELNLTPDIECIQGDIKSVANKHFDLVLANITRNILTEYMDSFYQMINIDGKLLISGFFAEDIEDLCTIAKISGFAFVKSSIKNRWAALLFTKNR